MPNEFCVSLGIQSVRSKRSLLLSNILLEDARKGGNPEIELFANERIDLEKQKFCLESFPYEKREQIQT